MADEVLRILHIAVLGYWLGAELVINSTYRHVAYSVRASFEARTQWMEHVMDVDQHVRYALVLQAMLGTMLAARHGYVPGDAAVIWGAGTVGLLWLAFVEAVHHWRHEPSGRWFAMADRYLRYGLIGLLLAMAAGLIGTAWPLAEWLRWKLGLFAGVIACGVGIRFFLIRHFRTWSIMARDGPSDDANAIVKRIYWQATALLGFLWALIAAIVVLSVWRPT
ncbi:MAG: hypothetical protein D6782_07840 [Alphaproteobacteria bacterium]|nr:MAG: hypothetical protein D6782_07840 [Alphaproteobacteria bacterium]